MDPNRQHEFIGSNEERSRPMYFNRGMNDVRSYAQYFPQDRAVSNKKPCGCTSVSGNIMCNGCRTSTAEGSWASEQSQRPDFAGTRNPSRQSPMYVDQNLTSRAYWQQSNPSFTDESLASGKHIIATSHMDRNAVSKNCAPEMNFNFKQQQQPPPLPRPSAIGTFCKERVYDDKYSAKQESVVTTKIPYSPAAASYNVDSRSTTMEAMRVVKTDQHIINPSNVVASKEQHPSPNYARKCPQMFSPEEQNSAHLNLYMSTPQFSSEKFTNIHTQQNMTRESSTQQEYRGLNSSTGHIHLLPEISKHRESTMQISPAMPVYSSSNKFYQVNETMQAHVLHHQQQLPYVSGNYYPGSSKVHAPEMSPIITKQTHHHYNDQYSSNPMPPSASHLAHPAKAATRDITEYLKKEDDPYDGQAIPNRSMYVNPYNTPSSSDSCCKEPSSPYTAISSFRGDSPQEYQKYGKGVQETLTANKMSSLVNQNTPPRTPSYRGQPYYYETQNHKYDGNHHNATSPAVATVASPSPALSTSQGQIHHTDYVTQQPQQAQPYQNPTELRRSSVRTQEIPPPPPPPPQQQQHHLHNTYERQVQQSSNMACINNNNTNKVVQPMTAQSAPILQLPPQTSKKSQLPKPNYRELINQAYAKRNATSEKELNMQIIQKALNVDTQIVRSAAVPSATNVSVIDKSLRNQTAMSNVVTPPQTNYARDAYRTDIMPKLTGVNQDIRRHIKQEEKPNVGSPLDLSMRTVKTKADSTEYKYRRLPAAAAANTQNVDCKYALPRVNFTPNFTQHIADQPPITKHYGGQSRTDRSERHVFTSSELNNIAAAPPPSIYPNGESPQHTQPRIKTHLRESVLDSKLNIPTYESKLQTAKVQYAASAALRTDVQITSNSLVFKSATKPVGRCDLKVCQMRPSVLETNPYALAKGIKAEPKLVDRNSLVMVDQLPPDTSIMPLPKPPAAAGVPQMIVMGRAVDQAAPPPPPQPAAPQSAYSLACERNPNFLGRKRHLQEYSTSKYNEPLVKQPRYQEPPLKPEYIRPSELTVIAVNEKPTHMEPRRAVECALPPQAQIACYQQNSTIIVNSDCIGKIEPITPTAAVVPLPITPIKTEINSAIAARIRTKAELKGFTFPPPIIEVMASVSLPKDIVQIKEEPSQTPSMDLLAIPGLTEEFSQGSLLDFGWNNTCNNFVEQLLTTTKKSSTKKKMLDIVKPELSEDDLPVAAIALKSNYFAISTDMQPGKEDSTISYAIGENNISNMESAETNMSFGRMELNDSAMTMKSISQDTIYPHNVLQKKISKLDREKMRLHQERRIAARWKTQDESSSESDNELDKRKTERLKKPLMKGKARPNSSPEKNRFSDCGSDSSSGSVEDNGPQSKSIKKSNEQQEKAKVAHKKSLAAGKEGKNGNGADSSKESLNASSQGKGERQDCAAQERQGSKCANTSNNKITLEKPDRKQKLYSKVGLNTMTRSKRKRELELQLANSKVLRNEKIIRNSTTKIKRKYVRKFGNGNSNSTCNDSSNRGDGTEVMSTRLRSKNGNGNMGKVKKTTVYISKKLNKSSKDKSENHNAVSSSNAKGKERQADLLMEVYRYKRSLKIPASLISLKHPGNHKIAASLPDLERRDIDEMSVFTNRLPKTSKLSKLADKSTAVQQAVKSHTQTLPEEHRSIIDLLHSRVINSTAHSKSKTTKAANNSPAVHLHSETSQNTECNSVSELLLPHPKKDDDEDSNDGKKRHFSIFETKVLQTKTRTESKLRQKKEIIREIFVGDDRPASAPPEMTPICDSGSEKMTYEQKYEQFLQQMNIVNSEDKLHKLGRPPTTSSTISSAGVVAVAGGTQGLAIKQEEDTESASAIDVDEKLEQDSLSIISGTPTSFGSRRRRPGKYLRRKGSSGFDYIRKKKKPTPHAGATSTPHPHAVLKSERTDEYYETKTKTESDVCREVQKWVLNKGVGQSAMHKAARLGYIDVIVYCLDRMNMNPDQKDNAGYTPLHEACTKGWLEIARILLQYGANHSEAALSGIRPLHEASENGHKELVRLLLSYGADPLLATYSGQTPLMLASSSAMRDILNNHLSDVQSIGRDRKSWRFNGPWELFDATKCGYDTFGGAPNFTCDMSRALRKSSVSSLISNKKQFNQYGETSSKTVMDKCAVVLDNIDRFNSVRLYNDTKPEYLVENSDSEGEMFEFEEADVLLPPLYLLKDEGTEKWVLLNDLCNLLKVKSKDTLLNKIYPSSSHKSLMRELKMSDFLEKATCLQLLCAGEKINICASKVVLIKYNESVRNLLGVKTILMKF